MTNITIIMKYDFSHICAFHGHIYILPSIPKVKIKIIPILTLI